MIREPEHLWRVAAFQRLAAINFQKGQEPGHSRGDLIRFQLIAQTYARLARRLMGIEDER